MANWIAKTGDAAREWLAVELDRHPPQRIFAPGREHIGDAVNLTGPLTQLRKRFPDAEIVAEVGERTLEVFKNFKEVDEIWARPTHQGIGGKLKHILRLREQKFDLAVLLDDSNDLVLQAYLGGIPRRVGIWRGKKYRDMFTALVPLEREMHEVRDHADEVLSLLGHYKTGCPPNLVLSQEDEKIAEEAWNELKIEGPCVAIHPGSSEENRCWDLDKLAALADLLHNDGITCLVVGGPGEQEKVRKIEEFCKPPVKTIYRPLPLRSFAALLKKADVFVGMDSGPMHLAAAVGTTVCAIYGPAYASHTGPFGREHVIIQGECSCPLRHWDTCTRACLDSILVEDVHRAVVRLVAARRTACEE